MAIFKKELEKPIGSFYFLRKIKSPLTTRGYKFWTIFLQKFFKNRIKVLENEKKSPKIKEYTQKMPEQNLQILGVGINSTSASSVLEFVAKKITKKEKFWIATPNPEMIVLAQKDWEFKKILNSADLAIPDGIGLVWASRLLGQGKAIKERITGVDLMEALCREASLRNWKIFLLGGRGRVAEKALEALKKRYPRLEGKTGESQRTLNLINTFQPELLFVGFGAGKQERWVVKYLPKLKIGGALVVGGAFDYLSGRIPRAPKQVQNLGLEWLFRLIRQPRRWRRQLALVKFIFLVVKQKFLHLRSYTSEV